MSSGIKCRNCGSIDIEEDNARGDQVCMNCGSVLEDSLIVSEVQFEEIGHASSAIGQFVSGESNGGPTNLAYGTFHVGSFMESREVTLKKAKKEITHLCQRLQLSQHHIDIAVNYFRMALNRNLTRGRKSTHVYAAVVYLTCRTEETSHLLIDISDAQQICSYELGRTYLRITNALCIATPSVDPCIYVMRFANKLQFGSKTHEVSMTALRIVQRMKKDCIHSGRRPTGLCGAALLIAARMHDFNRTIKDVIKIVKIHESTLRKRLTEFAETPSSSLTLDEFMEVDLEAEQDPPAFITARKKDRERIKDIGEAELTELQKKIDLCLDRERSKICKNVMRGLTGSSIEVGEINNIEKIDAVKFIEEANLEALQNCLDKNVLDDEEVNAKKLDAVDLKPDLEKICRIDVKDKCETEENVCENEEINLQMYDDEELNNCILTDAEVDYKTKMWETINAGYLNEMKEKEEKQNKLREEGKPEKKKRKPRKKNITPSATAGEAIEKMLQEKKFSSKINYDILRSLTEGSTKNNDTNTNDTLKEELVTTQKNTNNVDISIKERTAAIESKTEKTINRQRELSNNEPLIKKPKIDFDSVVLEDDNKDRCNITDNEEIDDEYVEEEEEEEVEFEPEKEYSSLKDILSKDTEDDYYDYEDENY